MMKNVSTKIAYMVIGSILTLIGYHFGNIENNTVDAQEDNPIAEEIRSRRFVLVGQNDNIPRVVIETTRDGHGSIAIGNQDGMLRLLLDSSTGNGMETGGIRIYQEDGEIIASIGSDQYGGSMSIYNRDRVRDGVITNTLKPVVQILTTSKGHGVVLTQDADEDFTGGLGPTGTFKYKDHSRSLGVLDPKLNIRVDRLYRLFVDGTPPSVRKYKVDGNSPSMRKYKSDAPGDVELEDRALTVDDLQRLRDRIPSALPKILREGDKIPPFKEEDCQLRMFITWKRSTIGEVNEIEFRPDGKSQIMLKDGTHYTSPNGCTIRDFTIISGSLEVYVPGQIPPVSK